MPVIQPRPLGYQTKLIPEGRYIAVVVAWEIGQAMRAPGVRHIKWTFQIDEGEHRGAQVPYFTVFEGGRLYMLNSLIACFDPAHRWNEEFDPDFLLGKKVEIKIGYPFYRKTNRRSPFPKVTSLYPYVNPIETFEEIAPEITKEKVDEPKPEDNTEVHVVEKQPS